MGRERATMEGARRTGSAWVAARFGGPRRAIASAFVAVTLVGAALVPAGRSQSNTIDGLDLKLIDVTDLQAVGRAGTYPNGRNGVSMETTCCNVGTVDIAWQAAMDPDHPTIAFQVVRELDGRMVQISDRSFLKHGFFSTNSNRCGNCQTGNSRILGVNCSDTYDVSNNSDRYWLGPADEVDPWLGVWEPVCSHFDQGEPPVPPPADCDGRRSLTDAQVRRLGPVTHRIEIDDADLDLPEALYYFGATYLVAGEADQLRANNQRSRQFIPSFGGTRWNFALPNDDTLRSSILRWWTDAVVQDVANGEDDGRVFVASKVTGPDTQGKYHYEYAIHNRDNARGVGSFTIPFCPGALIENIGFRDIDRAVSNEWTAQVGTHEIEFRTTDNPVRWNTIYNFWFDSDTPPASGQVGVLGEFDAGAGFDQLPVQVKAPMGPNPTDDLGYQKAGADGLFPDLRVCGGLGTGESATLMLRHAFPASIAILVLSDQFNPIDYRGGQLVPIPPTHILIYGTDSSGEIFQSVAGPGGGIEVYAQFVVTDPTATQKTTLSNALKIRIDP